MSKTRGTGFQKRTKPSKFKPVGMAIVKTLAEHAECSCGWTNSHSREKVREDAIDRHLNKRHNGRGLRM